MRLENRKAKNVYPGMHTVNAKGDLTEIVEVRKPRSDMDGLTITTRYDKLMAASYGGGGKHYGQDERVLVARGL
jgi:hypothetical protein